MAAICFLASIEEIAVKAPLAIVAFLVGVTIGLVYFFYFVKRNRVINAVRDLSSSFQKDIETLVKAPIRLDDLD